MMKKMVIALTFISPFSASYADDLDLIPDDLLGDVIEVEQVNEEEDFLKYWNFSLRTQLQTDLVKGESTDDPSLYVNLSANSKQPLAKGQIKTNLSLRSLYQQDTSYHARDDIKFDLKELYYSHNINQSSFIDIGRINYRSGLAFGYNPSDYFKENLVVDDTDTDARSRSYNRLGTVAVRYQNNFDQQSLTMMLSPEIQGGDKDFNFHNSNPITRGLLSYSVSSAQGWYTQFDYFHAETDSLGLSSSVVLSDKILGYFETSLSRQRTLLSSAIHEAMDSNTLPPSIVNSFKEEEKRLRHQSSIGLSYSSEWDIVTNIEYHHSELSASDEEQKTWYRLLQEQPQLSPTLWGLRGSIAESEEPFVRRTLWLRSVWSEPIDHLNIGLISSYLIDDKSYSAHFTVSYDYSDNIDLTTQISTFEGDDESFYGTLPIDYRVYVQLNWFF